MSLAMTPSKRPQDQGFSEPNEKGKLQKTTGSYSQIQASKTSSGKFVFRLLCPSVKTGGVIGRGGSIISQMRKESGAKIRVEEAVAGSDERIILITGSEKEVGVNNDHGKNQDEVSSPHKKDNGTEENADEGNADKEVDRTENRQSERDVSSAQKALLLVFGRIAEDGTGVDGSCTARLLIFSYQVAFLLGKGGLKQLSSESGAQIRILPRDKLPLFVSLSDELVQITGGLDTCKKALQLVSQQILDNSTKELDSFPPSLAGILSHSISSQSELIPPTALPLHVQGTHLVGTGPRDGSDHHSPKLNGSGVPSRKKPQQDIISFRLLCRAVEAGHIIGKGGSIVRGIELDTGCEIKVFDDISDSEDRIIIVSGHLRPEERVSGAQEAVFRIQNKISEASPVNFEKKIVSRILVSSNQIGCILGKGGSIVTEMRKSSGAQIRILGKDKIPKCASENEEVVQITGDFETVQNALLQITSRLQHHFFGDPFPSITYNSNPVFLDQDPPFSSHMGRRLGPPLHKFDSMGGLLPHNDFHDDKSFLHRPLVPSFPERRPFSASWGPLGSTDSGGSIGLLDSGGIPPRRLPGFGGGNPPPIITNTTFEVRVPCAIVPLICGDDGDGCLKQIREISEAKIMITDPMMGAPEAVIIISGTPDQTQAAQSLIQAFVLSENES